ncbi:MAG TPA: hypothetical protein ENI33_00280 [Thermoplasmatales archaeon]|nr:hypothetical protein [Thermoplasmatales archaeon]
MKYKNFRTKGSAMFLVLILAGIIPFFISSQIGEAEYTYELKNFSSYDELFNFIKKKYEGEVIRYYENEAYITANGANVKDTAVLYGSTGDEYSLDYSKTNIQVEGVDEADVVKTDGKYIYLISENKVFIIEAYPPENATVLSKIVFNESNPNNIFVNGNNLLIFSSSFAYLYAEEKAVGYGTLSCEIKIYNITDRKNPQLISEIKLNGNYFDSRMIGNYVYVITTEYPYTIYRTFDENETMNIPVAIENNFSIEVPPSSIYYIDMPERIEVIAHIVAIDIKKGEIENQKMFLLGGAGEIYVSKNNIYIAYIKYEYGSEEVFYGGGYEKTIIYKISIDEKNISYSAQGEVPGRILNQFSMDEYNKFFRIATTSGSVWKGDSTNSIYILNENLSLVSSIQNIAVGERIYSARFVGEKAYLVTFKKVDPFFTIDLSDPYNPKILGKLKIPGYSNYLHPYDENHVIGIGKETVEASIEEKQSRNIDFAWYQGLKISLFDITDFENPKEISKVIIGDRGTDSPVLYDHKALLFDREKGIFVIPVRVCEISDEIKEKYNYTGNIYGEFTFQGAYVYNISIERGFEFKGRITHMNSTDEYWNSYYYIKRSLYIENSLYTFSDKMVKINNLNTLEEIKGIYL